jgi:hypothetical protein
MLEGIGREHSAAELIAALPCNVELPAELRKNFEQHGVAPFADDRRRFPRVNCRSENNRAAMQHRKALPQLKRETNWQSVYVTNVSRDGLGFLHCEALYPCEQVRLFLLSGKKVNVEIVSCRRLHARCFEIGAQIAVTDQS